MFKQYNYKEPIRSQGCCFCCDCYLAGLNGNIEEAFDYAVSKGWVNGTDAYVNNHSSLINGLKNKYGTSERNGKRVKKGNHFVVEDGNRNFIYNPAKKKEY